MLASSASLSTTTHRAEQAIVTVVAALEASTVLDVAMTIPSATIVATTPATAADLFRTTMPLLLVEMTAARLVSTHRGALLRTRPPCGAG